MKSISDLNFPATVLTGALSIATALVLAETAPTADPARGLSRPTTTFEKFLPLALEGDPEVQNFIGFMYFYGEGVERDFEEAHRWFHLSAEQGNLPAQKNLGFFHSRITLSIPARFENLDEANIWFSMSIRQDPTFSDALASSQRSVNTLYPSSPVGLDAGALDIGRKIYATFCSGCHGGMGIAAYTNAPSFARGERMDKSDEVLVESVLQGLGEMPSWGATISPELAQYTIAYIRQRVANHTQAHSVETPPASSPNTTLDGEHLYTTFCAGCHGFNGIAYYVNSPSFAMGQRMEKTDHELLQSIANGKGEMPSWKNMLSVQERRQLLKFVRSLQIQYKAGIGRGLRSPAALYFRFRPIGATEKQWGHALPKYSPHEKP